MPSCYHYLNQVCPKCGKLISPQYYTIVKGRKYHIDCIGD